MQTLTQDQIHTAIEVLRKLEERAQTLAENSAIQLAEFPGDTHESGRIRVTAIEQATRIESVLAQLEQWRTEFSQQKSECVSHHV